MGYSTTILIFLQTVETKKKSRVIAYVHSCVFRVELDESQCKYVESVHSNGKFCVRLSMLRIVG